MLKWIKNQKGFTFLETIMTTMVLGVGLWGTLSLFQNATANTINNDIRTLASELATEKIETIIADKTFTGYDSIIQDEYPEEALTGSYSGLTRTTTITEVDPSDYTTPSQGSGYKRVEVTISWGNESYQSLDMVTILSSYTS